MEEVRLKLPSRQLLKRIVICTLVLGAGLAAMLALGAMKKPPAEAKQDERSIRVDVLRVSAENAQITITGYGDVMPLNRVEISPEVSGRIVAVHPRLESGEVIPDGEELFRIDDRDYRASFEEARATAGQWTQTILRLRKQLAIDRERLKTLERSRELAKAEFERLKRLYEVDQVGTRSAVESAERAYNADADQAAQMAEAVEIYPVQIREAQNSLAAAEARKDLAAVRLDRCVVNAPFTGRVRDVAIESGQYVSAGHKAVTLADDSILEIHVPLDSRDARRWLPFDGTPAGDTAWFSRVPQLDCTVRWTEAPATHFWEGRLDRVVRFEAQTRTVTVAVRVTAENAVRNGEGLPLVEGMFCLVEIPGRMLDGVFRVPRHAVSFENTVYVARDDRLQTIPVEVARIEGEDALISAGLAEGERVIVTRLVDPLEHTLLTIEEEKTS